MNQVIESVVQFDVIMFFFEMFCVLIDWGIISWVVKQGCFGLCIWNLCDFMMDNYCMVDDCLYGGGLGMVMLVRLFEVVIDVVKVVQVEQGIVSMCVVMMLL